MTDQFEQIIIKAAETFRLDSNLIRAICAIESAWNPEATRFEPEWRYFNNPRDFANHLGISVDQETENQATSWGLMQVMGAVARDLGFTDNIEMLKDPNIGIYYGSKKLKQLYCSRMCNNEEDRVIAAYNAGSPRLTEGSMFENQQYVDKVCSVLRDLRKLS